ncbi:PH domain-containing protein [Streptomyces sp. NPDC007346]|uniref:PH domain-containing protein n=1 Tax=Streptomyces sp. NPDC007346 TaxID=3154682 RepID=UPI0034538DA4
MNEPIEGRLHPVTPLRRSWAVLLALGLFLFQQHDLFAVGSTGTKDRINVPLWAAVLALTLIVAAVTTAFVIGWRHSHFRLDRDVLEYRYGLLVKVGRRMELRHVQSVDIGRPFLGRPLSVCTLRVVMPGTTMTLSYLTLNQARALKARILAEDTTDETLYRVTVKDLALSLLLDVATNIRSLILGAFAAGPYVTSGNLLTLSTVLVFAPKLWRLTGKRFFAWSGWTVTRAGLGQYRVDHGMFDTQQYTYRDTRIASLELHQPVLWRRFDWVQVKAAVVGAGSPGILVPVCPRPVAEKLVLHLLGPAALVSLTDAIPAPPAARRATLFHRALGYRLHDGYLTAWNGYFLRNLVTVCPVARIQTVTVDQGPWQRRLGLATVKATLSGGSSVQATHRTTQEAADLAPLLHAQSKEHAHPLTADEPGTTDPARVPA